MREWDPATAPDAEIAAIVATLNEVLAVDLPDDPQWQPTGIREYLTESVPGERRVCWMYHGEDPAGGDGQRTLGHANLLLLGDIGVLEVLVHPSVRERGVGRALVVAAARRSYSEGIASLGVEVVGGTAAIKFWESLGFRCAYIELRSVLKLSDVDHSVLARAAATVPAGYRIEYHPRELPKPMLEPYAAAKAYRRDIDDLELHPSSYDAQRLADSLATLNRRGMRPHLVLAVHEQTGAVAALTEVVVPAQHPGRADQYDTIVTPNHYGRGLELAVKARMLLELSQAEPQLVDVQTWNTLTNDPLAEVNAELGYRPDREWREYEADVLDLISRLGH